MSRLFTRINEKIDTIEKMEENISLRLIDIPLECQPGANKDLREMSVLSKQMKRVMQLRDEINLLIEVIDDDEYRASTQQMFDEVIEKYKDTHTARRDTIVDYYNKHAQYMVEQSQPENVQTENNGGLEYAIGLKVSNVIGALLILIGVLWFSTVAFMLFGNVGRSILTTLIGIGFAIPGYVMYSKNKKNIFSIGILGCGISILYASVLLGCVAYDVYSEIMMLLLLIVLTAIMNSVYLKFKSEWLNVYMVIGCYLPCCTKLLVDDSMVMIMSFYLIAVSIISTVFGARGKNGVALCVGAFLNFIATVAFLCNSGDMPIVQLFVVGTISIIYIYTSSVASLLQENVGKIQRTILTIAYTVFSVITFCAITPQLTKFDSEVMVTYTGNIIELAIIYIYLAVLYFMSHLIKVGNVGSTNDADSAINKATYVIMRVIILCAGMLCTELIRLDEELVYIIVGILALLFLAYAEYSKKIEFNIAGLFGWGTVGVCTIARVSHWMYMLSRQVGYIVYDYASNIYGERAEVGFNMMDIACFIGVAVSLYLYKTWRNKEDIRGYTCKFLMLQPLLTILVLVLGLFDIAFEKALPVEIILLSAIMTPAMYAIYKAVSKACGDNGVADYVLDAIAGAMLLTLNISMISNIQRIAGHESYEDIKVLINLVSVASCAVYSMLVYWQIHKKEEYIIEFKVIAKMVITLYTVFMAFGLLGIEFTSVVLSLTLIVLSSLWLSSGFKQNIKVQRVISLILLMISTVKLCIVDVIAHNPVLIMVTCFACGLSLFGISLLYQKLEKKHANNL